MSRFEHDHSRWLDGEMNAEERAAFEEKLGPGASGERAEWEAIRSRLRAAPEALHAREEFLNTRVRAAIRERRPSATARALAWLGAGCVAAAAVIAFAGLPRVFQPLAPQEFFSQVVATRVEDPRLAVYTFKVPEGRGSVLWVVGNEFIPAEEKVR